MTDYQDIMQKLRLVQHSECNRHLQLRWQLSDTAISIEKDQACGLVTKLVHL